MDVSQFVMSTRFKISISLQKQYVALSYVNDSLSKPLTNLRCIVHTHFHFLGSFKNRQTSGLKNMCNWAQ